MNLRVPPVSTAATSDNVRHKIYPILSRGYQGGPIAGSGYDVDPAVPRTQGGVFGGIGSGFTRAASELQATLKATEEAWGGDDFVSTFNDFYMPVSEGIVTSMPHLGDAISEIGGRLEAMGAQYETTEQARYDDITSYAAGRPDLTI